MTTFAIVSAVPVSGVIAMPSLGVFLGLFMLALLAGGSAVLLPAILRNTYGRANSSDKPRHIPDFGNLGAYPKSA